MKKVLVLMSSYNGEKYIKDQIESIFAQKGVEVSLQIRDDGSKDNTVAIIKDLMSKKANIDLISGTNMGFSESFMSLVLSVRDHDSHDYYAFADQDDIWLEDKLVSAVNMLEKCEDTSNPCLYFSNTMAVDEYLKPMFETHGKSAYISKPTALLRYFMLGCTMVFNKATVQILERYRPSDKITMHDLWIHQTCAFLGHIVYDPQYHIFYRQHGNNTAGIGNDWEKRIKRLRKSFKTYERRHFREINAKNLLSAYGYLLSPNDYELIATVANYKSSFKNRVKLLMNKDINMGSFTSDLFIKLRIIFGVL